MKKHFIISGILLALIGIGGAALASNQADMEPVGASLSPTLAPERKTPKATPKKQGQLAPVGYLEGSVVFPAGGVPKDVRVCAVNLNTTKEFCTRKIISGRTFKGGRGYRLAVPSGKYQVYSVVPAFDPGYQAFYSAFVVCGYDAACTDHTPITVSVRAGQTRQNIEPGDFYD